MTETQNTKLKTLTGVLGVGSLALLGATACDDTDGAETEPGVEENGVDDTTDDGLDNGDADEQDPGVGDDEADDSVDTGLDDTDEGEGPLDDEDEDDAGDL